MTGLPKNLFNKIKSMIFQFTSSQRSDIAALQTAVGTLESEWIESTINIPLAQILAMGVTPIEVLPANPAAAYEYDMSIAYVYGSAQLTVGLGTSAFLIGGKSVATTFLTQAASKLLRITSDEVPVQMNQAVTITTDDGGNLGGGTGGQIVITLKYKEISLI